MSNIAVLFLTIKVSSFNVMIKKAVLRVMKKVQTNNVTGNYFSSNACDALQKT